MTSAEPTPDPPILLQPLLGLVHSLRVAGVPVSTSEVIDATAAIAEIDLADRQAVKFATASTLVKRAEDREAFETLFELHFAVRSTRSTTAVDEGFRPVPHSAG